MSTLAKVALSFIGQLKPDRAKARAIALEARRVTGYQDSAVAAGAIVQNVYLFCASAGLATVVRAWLDRKALAKALRLSEHESIIAAQTVGYPRG